MSAYRSSARALATVPPPAPWWRRVRAWWRGVFREAEQRRAGVCAVCRARLRAFGPPMPVRVAACRCRIEVARRLLAGMDPDAVRMPIGHLRIFAGGWARGGAGTLGLGRRDVERVLASLTDEELLALATQGSVRLPAFLRDPARWPPMPPRPPAVAIRE